MPEPKSEIKPVSPPIRIFSATISKAQYDQQESIRNQQIQNGSPKPNYIFHDLRQPPTAIHGYAMIIDSSLSGEKRNLGLSRLTGGLKTLIRKSLFDGDLVTGYDQPPSGDYDPKEVFSDNSLSLMLNEPLTQDNFWSICHFFSDVRRMSGKDYSPQAIADDYLERLQDYPQDSKPYYMVLDEIKYYQQSILEVTQNLTLAKPYSDYLAVVDYNASRLTDLTESSTRLLERNTDKEIKYTLSDPVELVQSCVEDFQKQFEIGNLPHIGVTIPQGLAIEPFYFDQTIVKNLVGKIIHNAWKYGVLQNDATQTWFHLPVNIELKRDADSVSISIVDHGIGLTNQEVNYFNDSIKNGRSSTSVTSGIEGKGEGLAGDRFEARKSGIKVQVSSTGVKLDPVDVTKEENYRNRQTIFSIRIPIRNTNPSMTH